jgi:hypothetical protein
VFLYGEATHHYVRRLIFNGLHGVISQTIEFFITTAVRTSNPTSILIIRIMNYTCNLFMVQVMML